MKDEIMKFSGKQMEQENTILNKSTETQKD